MVFSQFKFPANLAQLVVPKMQCLYAKCRSATKHATLSMLHGMKD